MTQKRSNEMERVAEGIYRRNGKYIVPIWNPAKGRAGGKDWHTLGPDRCSCGVVHERKTQNALNDAKRLKLKLEDEKSSGRRRGVKTVAEWVGYWESDGTKDVWTAGEWLRLVPRKSEGTNIHNDSRVRAFGREFVGRTLASITEEEAAGFALQNPGSFKEVHAMMNDACAKRLIERNPFAGIKVPAREGRRHIVTLTDAELEMLAGIARVVHGSYGPLFASMIEVAAWTGMRPSELFLVSLWPDDQLNFADLEAGVVNVDWQLNGNTGKIERPKKESQRQIVLLPAAERALRAARKASQDADIYDESSREPLFLTKRGKRFNQRTHFYYWDGVRKAFEASLPQGHHIRQRMSKNPDDGFDFYELRHFFGSTLAHPPAGVAPASPQDIAKMMGHKDGGELAMRIYIHTKEADARERIRSAWKKAS